MFPVKYTFFIWYGAFRTIFTRYKLIINKINTSYNLFGIHSQLVGIDRTHIDSEQQHNCFKTVGFLCALSLTKNSVRNIKSFKTNYKVSFVHVFYSCQWLKIFVEKQQSMFLKSGRIFVDVFG